MALIQSPVIARKLQRLLRLTGLPDSVLSPETVPVIVVEDVSDPLLGEAKGCAGVGFVAAVAAEFPKVVLVRVGSPAQYRLKVTRIFYSSTGAGQVTVRIPTVAVSGLTISGNTSFLDLELPGRPSSQLATDTIAVPIAARPIYSGPILSNTIEVLDVDIDIGTVGVRAGLSAIEIEGDNVNRDLIAGFFWTEAPPLG